MADIRFVKNLVETEVAAEEADEVVEADEITQKVPGEAGEWDLAARLGVCTGVRERMVHDRRRRDEEQRSAASLVACFLVRDAASQSPDSCLGDFA